MSLVILIGLYNQMSETFLDVIYFCKRHDVNITSQVSVTCEVFFCAPIMATIIEGLSPLWGLSVANH